MGNVIMCAGGGGVKSDDVTATLANVLEGKTALTSDSDDDVGVGTMPECGAITLAPTGNNTLTSGEGHYDSVTADGSLAYAAGLSYGTAILLGTGTSFNVSKYSYYGSLTTDDFVVEPASLSLDYVSPKAKPTYTAAVSTHVWGSCCITKSYDASTGVLTAYASMSAYSSREGDPAYGTSNTGAVKVYLMPKK